MLLAAVLGILAGCSRSSGDRVLVAKCLYDSGLAEPKRFDVVVFKYPEKPVEAGTPKNYIKRLLGLPGQILAIFFGQLFFWKPEPGEELPYNDFKDPKINRKDLWNKEYMHIDDKRSEELFETPGKFKVIRKPPDVMMALRRIVYDNDFPASDLKGKLPPRWSPSKGSRWAAHNDHREFSHAADKLLKPAGAKPGGAGIDWLRYQHILRPKTWPDMPAEVKPELITDFMGYNSFVLRNQLPRNSGANWVGNLMLECKLHVQKTEGAFFMELSKGINRFRARWELDTGLCTLFKQGPDGKWTELASQSTKLKKPGSYDLRFANFDAQLTVWVDRDLPFGDGKEYPPPEIRDKGETKEKLSDLNLLKRRGPTENDLEPASIGAQEAAVKVQELRLWRDSYYTLHPENADAPQEPNWSDPASWEPLRNISYKTMYVQPEHYLCLGDNSRASSDSRQWGVVPQRLMLGRALLVYFPLSRAGPIR